MHSFLLIVVCFLLLAIGSDGKRHHKHGDPDKVARKRVREELERKDGEGEEEHPQPVDQVGHIGILGEDAHDNMLPKPSHRGHGRKHHPVDEAEDTVYKDQWKRITNYHKSDADACSHLKCRRRQVCLINADTGEAECVHKRVLRMRRKMKKGQGQGRRKPDKKEEDNKEERRRKDRNGNISNSPDYTERLDNIVPAQPKAAFDYIDRSASKKSEVHVGKINSALHTKPQKECTKRDLDEMGRRLLDWFKLLMEEDERESAAQHHMTKRNSKKKELRDDDECICQAPVSWEFNQLDMNSNAQLSGLELKDIEDNGYEHCVRPFIDVCDHNHDMQLSEREWCCCFADILPPCLSAQRQIPMQERGGHSEVMVGAFVPSCDEDGFFERQQCHGSTGQCWCVDRNGHEIRATRTQGSLDCDKFTERYIQENI